MGFSEHSFKDHAEYEITYYRWLPAGVPKAIVQVAHGMGEHAKRYDEFAEALAQAGFVVYADDHRGHGKTSESTGLALLGSDGWLGTVDDLKELMEIAKKEYPNIPFFLFGHSWGSFLSQEFIEKYGDALSGVILSGTSGTQPMLGMLNILAKLITVFSGKEKVSPMMAKLSVDPLNKPFEPAKTPFDWLSRDDAVVQKYVDDPMCGFGMSNSYWLEFAKALKRIWKPANEAKIPKDLPVLLFSGENDPVNEATKNFMVLVNRYKAIGIQDVSYNIYPGARHETLNELEKEKTYQDVIEWIQKHL